LVFSLFDSLKDQTASLAKFHMRSSTNWTYQQSQFNFTLAQLVKHIKIYKKKEYEEKLYEENIMKNLEDLDKEV
jgi:phenylacetate-coenzyme A ligase PaaK-like adenylate-forming protein